jgi:hypothetical protein
VTERRALGILIGTLIAVILVGWTYYTQVTGNLKDDIHGLQETVTAYQDQAHEEALHCYSLVQQLLPYTEPSPRKADPQAWRRDATDLASGCGIP